MAILSVRFASKALAKQTTFNVIHPDQGEGPFPVLIQLHGFSDDCNSWLTNSNLARHVANLPLIVVLPDGGTSRYLNVRVHDRFVQENYEDLIMRDIPEQMARIFRIRDGKWAIGGLSMGGYGALRLGMKHPDRFASIWAHSAGLRQVDAALKDLLDDPKDADVEHWAAQLAGGDQPVMSFDCGVDDHLLSYNRDLHEFLENIGVKHTYREHPGAHTWDYWDSHVGEALAQHARVFDIEPVG
jgi:S-formylglutathione hydrolase FrmB